MKNIRRRQKHRTALLTLIFTVIVFAIFSFTMIIMGLLCYILIDSGVWKLDGHGAPNLFFILLAFALASIGVGTVLATTVGRIPFRPVGRLVNGLRQLSEGDYAVRLPEGKRGLMRELPRSFNTLAEELQNTEMLRSDFVNSFSHEFKTPIVSIQGFAQLLNRGGLSDEQSREYLGIIEEESQRLAAMATNVLNYSKIENQKILTGVAGSICRNRSRTCILLLEKKWTKKNLELSLEFQEHYIAANEELLKQVWINLLDNAVKFTPENGKIEVSINETPEALSVRIANTGSEIKPEEQKRIFQKFYQCDRSHAREGTGLGLTIAARIAELHRGSISVESRNRQTSFVVNLPSL